MNRIVFLSCLLFCIAAASACEQCKSFGTTPGAINLSLQDAYNKTDDSHHWYFDTQTEYIKYNLNVSKAHQIAEAERDTHGHVDEFNITEHISYSVNRDITVGIAQGFRVLRMKEIEDEDFLGQHQHSDGPNDLEVFFQYRFMHQKKDGFPVDLSFFASVKTPSGVTHNHNPQGELFETEDQPGTGSWNETVGAVAAKNWGVWNASAAYSFTHKGEGSQRFKEGDINRLALSGSRLMIGKDGGWRLYLTQGVQLFTEQKSIDHGVKSPDHGGQFIYAAPGVTVQPISRLFLTATGVVPLYQEENGFHQRDRFGVQLNIGVRF